MARSLTTGLLACLVSAVLSVAAEEALQHIYLRDGQVISGRVVSQNADKVWVRVSHRVLVLPKSRVRRIAYDTPMEQQHLAELRRQRAAANAAYERRLQDEIEKARRGWESERAKQERVEQRVQERNAEVQARQLKAGSLWRSAVLPGWGQVHRGEEQKGYIFGGLFLGSLFLWYRADRDFRSAADKYSQTTLTLSAAVLSQRSTASIVGSLFVAQTLNDEKRAAATQASIFQVIALGLYAVNVIDAVLFEGRTPSPPAKSAHARSGFFAMMNGDRFAMGVTVAF